MTSKRAWWTPALSRSSVFFLGLFLVAWAVASAAGARVLPSVDARIPPPELPRVCRGFPRTRSSSAAGARIGAHSLQRRDSCSTSNAMTTTPRCRALANRLHVPTRESTIENQLLFKTGDVYRASLLRGIGAHPARHALPARRADPAGCVPRRRGRRRSHHAGCVDLQSRRVLRTQGRQEHRRHRSRRPQFPGLGTQLGIGLISRRRSRLEVHLLPRPAARLLVVGPRDALLRQQRRPPRGVLPGASLLCARHALGRGRRTARRPARRFALRPGRGHRPVRDAREAVDYLLGTLRRPGRWLGAPLFVRPHLRRPHVRRGARCAADAADAR